MPELNTLLVDLAKLVSKRNGTGYDLQCPGCGDWVRRLMVTSEGKPVCVRCYREWVRDAPKHC